MRSAVPGAALQLALQPRDDIAILISMMAGIRSSSTRFRDQRARILARRSLSCRNRRPLALDVADGVRRRTLPAGAGLTRFWSRARVRVKSEPRDHVFRRRLDGSAGSQSAAHTAIAPGHLAMSLPPHDSRVAVSRKSRKNSLTHQCTQLDTRVNSSPLGLGPHAAVRHQKQNRETEFHQRDNTRQGDLGFARLAFDRRATDLDRVHSLALPSKCTRE